LKWGYRPIGWGIQRLAVKGEGYGVNCVQRRASAGCQRSGEIGIPYLQECSFFVWVLVQQCAVYIYTATLLHLKVSTGFVVIHPKNHVLLVLFHVKIE
jgi:hypothetical protein